MFPHKGPEDSHLILHMTLKIKAILLSKPQLIKVIIETLLRNAYNLGRLLQTHPVAIIGRRIMHIAPTLHTLNNLPYRPLLIALLLGLGRQERTGALHVRLPDYLAVLYHYDGRDEELRGHAPGLRDRDVLAGRWVEDAVLVVFVGVAPLFLEFGQHLGQVDGFGRQVYAALDAQRAKSVLVVEDEGSDWGVQAV